MGAIEDKRYHLVKGLYPERALEHAARQSTLFGTGLPSEEDSGFSLYIFVPY